MDPKFSPNNSGSASSPSTAAADSNVSVDNAAADAAAPSTERTDSAAASGQDAIAKLDADYRKNLLDPASEEGEPSKQTEPEEAVEPIETAPEPETVEESDDDERTGPRSLDDLKKQFPRVSTAPLEEIARVEKAHYELQQKVAALGGEVGLELSSALMPVLLSPASEENANALLQSVAETNPGLLQAVSWDFLTHSLNEKAIDPDSGKEIRDVTGDALLKQFVNPNLSLEKLFKLNEYLEAGLIDMDELDEELATNSGKTERELAYEARIKALEEGQVKETEGKELAAKARVQQHVDKTVEYISKGAMERIVAVADEYGWTATKEELNSSDPAVKALAESKIALGELLTPYVENFVRNHPKFAGVESLGRREEAFNADGNPTILLKQNGGDVITAAVASFKRIVRILNKNLAKSFATSRNAQLKAKTTRSGADDKPKIPPTEKPVENGQQASVQSTIDQLDQQYRRTVRDGVSL